MTASNRIYTFGFLMGLGLLAFCSMAGADGMVYAPLVVPKTPSIPQQRAIITWQEGVEKLIIDTSFQSDGKELAWIIPVPATPVEIKKVPIGVFTTLQFGLQPKVRNSATSPIFAIGYFILFWAVVLFMAGRFVPFQSLLFLAAFSLFIFIIGRPYESRRGEQDAFIPGVTSSGETRIGNYDIETLEADTSTHLNAWLSAHQYQAVPEKGISVVDDYIAKGWKFVAIQLHREQEGASRPHPLLISFPTETPIYPMRLTQLSGSDLHLDLFVFAPYQVGLENVKTIYSDRFEKNLEYSILSGQTLHHGRLALASLCDLVEDHFVLTWLQGDLPNAQLGHDFVLQHVPEKPTQLTVYTAKGAVDTSLNATTITGSVFVLLSTFLYYLVKPNRKKYTAIAASLLWGVAASIATYSIVYAALPKAPMINSRVITGESPIVTRLIEELNENAAITKKMTYEAFEAYVKNALKDVRNPYTGELLTFEEGPGDVVIENIDNHFIIHTYTISRHTITTPYQNTYFIGENQ